MLLWCPRPDLTTTPLQELTDIVKELDRVLSLHYTENQEVIRRCCYTPDGEPPTVREVSFRFVSFRVFADPGREQANLVLKIECR